MYYVIVDILIVYLYIYLPYFYKFIDFDLYIFIKNAIN